MMRPWITPDHVRRYTVSETVKSQDEYQLSIDIYRAEQMIINHCNNRFDAPEYEEEIPEPVRVALLIVAEACAMKHVEQASMKSETFDDYSYTASEVNMSDLNLDGLLDDYILDKEDENGKIKFRMRAI